MADWGGRRFRCSMGRGGVLSAQEMHETCGATPLGLWPMRNVFYRADRIRDLETKLSTQALDLQDGWCDAPDDPNYNRFVKHPYPASAEKLWREDRLYDLIVVLGYNDAPVVSGKGSAIFLHIARPGYAPTQGCVGLREDDLRLVLREARSGSCVEVLSL
jgi:L,D-peptidoglycan transpeptidase YkuD (ErfK/YbiS/YcfS/YnhG family)